MVGFLRKIFSYLLNNFKNIGFEKPNINEPTLPTLASEAQDKTMPEIIQEMPSVEEIHADQYEAFESAVESITSIEQLQEKLDKIIPNLKEAHMKFSKGDSLSVIHPEYRQYLKDSQRFRNLQYQEGVIKGRIKSLEQNK